MSRLQRGFTLIELLIVIAIVAILATAVVLLLNPVELLKQARDSRRLSELQAINSALNIYSVQGGSSFGSMNTVYTSLPDTSAVCASYTLPALPAGWSYSCQTSANYRNVDGTGWIPVNFKTLTSGAPFPALPTDPINTSANGYYYTYVIGSWELDAKMESQKYADQAGSDGGDLFSHFEVGSDLKIAPKKNLFGDGNYEGGVDGMGVYGLADNIVQSSTSYGAVIGSGVLYLKSSVTVNGGGTYGGAYKILPAMTAGKTYTMSYWAKGITGGGALHFSVQNGAGDENCLAHSSTISTTWQKFTKTCVLDLVKNTVYIWGGNGPYGGSPQFEWLIDGFQLVEGTE